MKFIESTGDSQCGMAPKPDRLFCYSIFYVLLLQLSTSVTSSANFPRYISLISISFCLSILSTVSMGWFWGDSKKDDPVKKLDPGLRDYLERETPSQDYVPTPQTEEPPKVQDARDQTPQTTTADSSDASKPKVPAASLYPDGRYAHIWKTYKPPSDPEESGVRSVERVIEKVKDRKDSVQRAAMENCALEQEEVANCFKTGNWQRQLKARMTMCSEENSKFARCFTTQAVSDF